MRRTPWIVTVFIAAHAAAVLAIPTHASTFRAVPVRAGNSGQIGRAWTGGVRPLGAAMIGLKSALTLVSLPMVKSPSVTAFPMVSAALPAAAISGLPASLPLAPFVLGAPQGNTPSKPADSFEVLKSRGADITKAAAAKDHSTTSRILDALFSGAGIQRTLTDAGQTPPAGGGKSGSGKSAKTKAEIEYAQGVTDAIESLAEGLAKEQGIELDAVKAEALIVLFEEAAERLKASDAAASAPSAEAFEAGLFLAEQHLRILALGARLSNTGQDLFRNRDVQSGIAAVSYAVSEVKTLAVFRAVAERTADETIVEIKKRNAVTEENVVGIYAASYADEGPFIKAEIRIKADKTYTLQMGNIDEAGPVFEGTWRLENGKFLGLLNVPGLGEDVEHVVDFSGKLFPELKYGTVVNIISSLIGPVPLRFNLIKTDLPYFPESKAVSDEDYAALIAKTEAGLKSATAIEQIRSIFTLGALVTGDRSAGSADRREAALAAVKEWADRDDSVIPVDGKEDIREGIEHFFLQYMKDPSESQQGFHVPFLLAVYGVFVPLSETREGGLEAIKKNLNDSLSRLRTVAKALVGRGRVGHDIQWLAERLTRTVQFFFAHAKSEQEMAEALGWLGYYLSEELPYDQDRDAVKAAAEKKFNEITSNVEERD